jgi:hypothetical protein
VPYVLTFFVIVLASFLLLGRFNIRRPNGGRRESAAYAGSDETLVEEKVAELRVPVPRRPLVFNGQPLYYGIEYHFHGKAGLVTIAPAQPSPSAVELRIRGEVWATYISARLAAEAVASGLTRHHELDAIPAGERPANLEHWEKSHPHYFRT